MADVSLRPALLTDLETVMDIVGRSLLASYGRFMPWEYLERWFAMGRHLSVWRGWLNPLSDNQVLLAETDSGPEAGTGLGTLMFDRDMIHELWVMPDQQSKGVGSRLMDLAESRIIDQGHPAVRLYAYSRNTRAIAFYERRGYAIERRLLSKDFPHLGLEYCIMRRDAS